MMIGTVQPIMKMLAILIVFVGGVTFFIRVRREGTTNVSFYVIVAAVFGSEFLACIAYGIGDTFYCHEDGTGIHLKFELIAIALFFAQYCSLMILHFHRLDRAFEERSQFKLSRCTVCAVYGAIAVWALLIAYQMINYEQCFTVSVPKAMLLMFADIIFPALLITMTTTSIVRKLLQLNNSVDKRRFAQIPGKKMVVMTKAAVLGFATALALVLSFLFAIGCYGLQQIGILSEIGLEFAFGTLFVLNTMINFLCVLMAWPQFHVSLYLVICCFCDAPCKRLWEKVAARGDGIKMRMETIVYGPYPSHEAAEEAKMARLSAKKKKKKGRESTTELKRSEG